jgi:DNA polymerase III epsilon subunit-like protein
VWPRIDLGRSRHHAGFPPDTPVRSQRNVVLDTELTSLDKRSNRILSIGLHHALSDAFLTAQLWQKLICAAESLGIRTLGDLLRIGK